MLSAAQVASACPRDAALVYASFQNIDKRYPPPFSRFERSNLRRAAGWIAFGSTVEEVLLRRDRYAARPHAVIPFGVDTARFNVDTASRAATRQTLGWQGEIPVIGFVGRFIEAKGIPMLLRALDALTRRGTPWHRGGFLLCGPTASLRSR